MHLLILGGTRFLGAEIAWRAIAGGHRVTLLNRGTRTDVYGDRVEHLRADRTTDALDAVLRGRTFDAAVDLSAYTGRDAAGAVRVLSGHVGHYVFISTGQVYLVRDRCVWPARESDYDGPLMAEPTDDVDRDAFRYGKDKRDAEGTLAAAWASGKLASTRLRIPMVHGAKDPYRRMDAYVWRLLDGGPILLPGGGDGPARHVYAPAVARAILAMLGDPRTFGQAYNLAQEEVVTVRALVEQIAEAVGATPNIVGIEGDAVRAAGLVDVEVSPFSDRWMSCLDTTRARLHLGFRHEPLAEVIRAVTTSLLGAFPQAPPPGYARRAAEVALARAHVPRP